MKKVLLATTALVATAGVAAAEVSFSGFGRFGLQYIEDNATTEIVSDTNTTSGDTERTVVTTDEDDAFLDSRFRLNIDANAETDGGVGFSGRVRLQADDNADGSAGTAGLNGAVFTTTYGGLRVDVGNIAGVIDNLQDYYGFEPGLTLFTGQYVGANFAFDAYTSTGAGENGVYAGYTFGDFNVAVSYSGDDAGDDYEIIADDFVWETGDSEQWGISAAYAGSNWGVAVGYAQSDDLEATIADYDPATGVIDDAGATTVAADADMVVLTGHVTFGDLTITGLVGDESSDGDPDNLVFDTFWGLSAGYNLGAATQILFSYGDGSAEFDTQAFGLGAIYDLGGGVSLRGGIGSNKVGDGDTTTVADLGVQFSF
ncbi:porin [Ruegeria sp. R13_0]|uniref:porin n=1 Tax=Ruegeria sp. R13_0 TaxID=2821099 RepID=UPI001AD96A8F|nr:porin [Ruegeria sp. R13_0]MBO9434731.1 porin [Ruegeria sp. R13_0]